MMRYWVYMVACADDTLYTGIATDLARRLAQHNGERARGARYTAARRPVALVYSASFATRSDALKEEHRLKNLSRMGKQALIIAASLPPKEAS